MKIKFEYYKWHTNIDYLPNFFLRHDLNRKTIEFGIYILYYQIDILFIL